jgi:parvulin-like peptidyl-prolyl isomerase
MADAAIAELEARLNTMGQSYVETLKRAEKAEAENERLKWEADELIQVLDPAIQDFAGWWADLERRWSAREDGES